MGTEERDDRHARQATTSKSAEATPRAMSTITMHPLADHVLVQALDARERSKSGIIIPDTAKERPTEGHVIAVGPGRLNEDGKRIAPEVKKGDAILYGKYSGTEIKLAGRGLLDSPRDRMS
jgi:chaperonin GroES